jgi:hypothetical protein
MTVVGTFELAAITLVILSSGFLQDDYLFFARVRQEGPTFHGFTLSVFGSLVPGFSVVDAAMAAMHPISRWPLILTVITLYALILVLFYGLLELVFGARPAIVAFTAIATTSGLLAVPLAWWTAGIYVLPAVAAALLALQELVRHARSGRRRHLVVAAVSFAVGVAFYDASMVVLVALLLFTIFYLADPCDRRSVMRALRARLALWIGCAIPITLNLTWRALHPTEYRLPPVTSTAKVLHFIGAGWAQGFAPSMLGFRYSSVDTTTGRWQAIVLGQAFMIGIVVASLVRRPSAWRAWAWFGASFIVMDTVAAIGRSALSIQLASNPTYWVILGFQFWIAVALAYLPSPVTIDGRPLAAPAPPHGRHAIRNDHNVRRWITGSTVTLVLCLLGLQAIWDSSERGMGAADSSYLANVHASWQRVSRADPAAFLWDVPAPWFVLSSSFAPYNRLSTTVGLVVPGLRFDSPRGNGYLIGSDGRIVPAASRTVSTLLPFNGDLGSVPSGHCLLPGPLTQLALPLSRALPIGQWIVSIQYLTPANATILIGDRSVVIPKGNRSIRVPAATTAPTHEIVLRAPARAPICLQMSVEDPTSAGAPQG